MVGYNPFEEPAFLEGLEAAGYLQRLDTSEERITQRYQHALHKMQFAVYSERFAAYTAIRKVHGSTVQFFNETPVSDPFVHIMCNELPPSRQALITPSGLPTGAFTPIRSPDEADGTIHFTFSVAGFWPVTVVYDSNPQDLPNEDRYAKADIDSDSDDDVTALGRRRSSTRGSMAGRASSRSRISSSRSDSGRIDSSGYNFNRSTGYGGRRAGRSSTYYDESDGAAAGTGRYASSDAGYRSSGAGRSSSYSYASDAAGSSSYYNAASGSGTGRYSSSASASGAGRYGSASSSGAYGRSGSRAGSRYAADSSDDDSDADAADYSASRSASGAGTGYGRRSSSSRTARASSRRGSTASYYA